MVIKQMKDDIGQFFDHFRKVSAHFRERLTPDVHSPANHELLAGKMACCALLDALSVARFPNRTHGERFRAFVGKFSKYEYWDRVSIPQLLFKLQHSSSSDDECLRKHAEMYLARRQGYAIKDDPRCPELTGRFPGSKKMIDDCCYLSLFYSYRCALVHEMRAPGYGYEFEYDERPCYRTQTEIPTQRRSFQLTYPLRFFFNVCDECIINLEQYFLDENRSPFDAYDPRFGDVWHRS
jgi:hypothetical protein